MLSQVPSVCSTPSAVQQIRWAEAAGRQVFVVAYTQEFVVARDRNFQPASRFGQRELCAVEIAQYKERMCVLTASRYRVAMIEWLVVGDGNPEHWPMGTICTSSAVDHLVCVALEGCCRQMFVAGLCWVAG